MDINVHMNSLTQSSKPRQSSLPRLKLDAHTIVLLVLLLLFERSAYALIPISAALCHELGHIVVMLLCKVQIKEVEITLFGAEIRSLPYENIGVFAKIAIYSAGCAVNLLTGYVALKLGYGFFAACSFTLAVLNLLPIRTLDGGCIFETVCVQLFPVYADTIVNAVSGIFIFFLWLISVYILLLAGGNISLMLFCMYMFVSLYLRR